MAGHSPMLFPPSAPPVCKGEVRKAVQVDKGHGRIEIRTLEATDILGDYLDWPGHKQVCRIARWRIRGEQESREVVYAITSLPRERASPQDLLALCRRHWGVENSLFYVRDVTFREDACRVRTGNAPQGLAALRNTAMALIQWLGFTNTMEGIEHFMDHRYLAVRLVRWQEN